jgi:AbiV family abortive infection protein
MATSTNAKAAAIVSSDKILHGVFLTIRQAWELLSAAQILQRAQKFPSAYGMAVFCREEVGKSRLLEGYWQASEAGKAVSARDLNSGALRSHAKKLQAVGKILSQGIFSQGPPPDPGSSEAREELLQLRAINARARELDPARTHLGRLRAFYVEMHEAGAGWWKPWTMFDSAKSSGEILEAETAYILRRYELEALKQKVGRSDIVLANSLHLPPEVASP